MANPAHKQVPLNAISAWIAKMETVCIALSALSLAAIMLIVMLDVILRYAFSAPLVWSYDLIGLYLVGAVFFFALSDTMQQHGHIALDVFQPMIPHRIKHAALSLGFAASTAFVLAIAWLELKEALHTYAADERIAAIVPMPTWVSHLVLTIGVGVLVLRCAYRTVFHALSAIAGRDLVELPPPPITDLTAAEHAE
ncbi:hypothetical protein ATO6_03095 [Oceanicola sp. 22II-s10i]|uniref:TRAP transporter small permease n=1 Tax=Oceanicola sp. 22II-s10i TaxID=1317116 RepID=UPI000B524FDF|nr:TRAP transporter small permease [Oceanicola sp. 22II-s10i]OWU85889.1 hypothetical protein ATO6_03095 [Oceanicola sp. 22II-s10i]